MVQQTRWLCRAISSRWLVPGDVVVLLPGKATCDMVLLQGNCLVEESMLSGEVNPCLPADVYISACLFVVLCCSVSVGAGVGICLIPIPSILVQL